MYLYVYVCLKVYMCWIKYCEEIFFRNDWRTEKKCEGIINNFPDKFEINAINNGDLLFWFLYLRELRNALRAYL